MAEIDVLSCLAHDNDQSDEILCEVLWKDIEGELWAFHAKTKDGIEIVFALAAEEIFDSIQNNSAYKNCEIEILFYSKNNSTKDNPVVVTKMTPIYPSKTKDGTPLLHNPCYDIIVVRTQ